MTGQIAAEDAHADIADITDETGNRHHDTGDELGFPGTFIEVFVQPGESSDGTILAIEGFHDEMSAVHFFNVAVDLAEGGLLGVEVFLRFLHDEGS